ncbi:MAG TPA: hypothetical protein VI454_02795 [Verrucomicrobiae bacterium]
MAPIGLLALAGVLPSLPAAESLKTGLIPDQPVQSVIPKQAGKRPSDSENSFSPLAPNSPVSGVVEMPWLMPQQQNNPNFRLPLSREKMEEADRKKDWIFASPRDKAYSAEKMLGVRDDSEALKVMDKEFKGVMQRYLEKGDKKNDANKDETSATNSSSEATAKNETQEPVESGSDRYRPIGQRGDSGFGSKSSTSSTEPRQGSSLMEPGSAASLFRGPGEFNSSFSLYSDSPRMGSLPTADARPDKTESQKAWANEFKQLLNSGPAIGGASSPFGRGNDPVNFFNDATRQPVNPVVGSGLDSLGRPGLSKSPFDTRPSGFDGLARPSGFNDAAPQIFGSSSLSPAVLAPTVPSVIAAPRPGVLEIPKRKF